MNLHLVIHHVRFELHGCQSVVKAVVKGTKFEIQQVSEHVCRAFTAHIIWKDGLCFGQPLAVRIDNVYGERLQRVSVIQMLRLSLFHPSESARGSFNQFQESFEASNTRNLTPRPAAGSNTRNLTPRSAAGLHSRISYTPFAARPAAGRTNSRHRRM